MKALKRRVGPQIGLRAPNGIAVITREVPGKGMRQTVAVADFGLGEVLLLNEEGTVKGRFGKGRFTRPMGVAAAQINGTPHLLVTDQIELGRGLLWHFVLEAESEPRLVWRAEGRARSAQPSEGHE